MGAALPGLEFDCRRLEQVFQRCFARSENTRLIGGADEPIYLPAGPEREHNELYYREDYFASALHEASHWCIAGAGRRRHVDFGYWYAPEGRNPQQQAAFEQVEVKPQALEWMFSQACGYRFRVSVDNLSADGRAPDTRDFSSRVTQQARLWQSRGLPPRALQFLDALALEFRTGLGLDHLDFGSLPGL